MRRAVTYAAAVLAAVLVLIATTEAGLSDFAGLTFSIAIVGFFFVYVPVTRYVWPLIRAILLRRQADQIVHRRAADLAAATGMDPSQIEAEMVSRRLTPGEWAITHGLDPITLRPPSM